jgi:putative toxin-antitoxin system antitoxin component (TIGR02293 family)
MDISTIKENPMERSEYKQIAEVLGGRKVFGRSKWSSLWWTVQIEKGLPFDALESLKEAFRLSDREISVVLDVSTKTASRWRHADKSRLPVSASDRIYRFARLFALAEHVLEDKDAARKWLHEKQVGLGGHSPIALMRTEAGAREVESLLIRIEHGVLS